MLQQSGVAAGLSAAFSAPLASVFFLVEEITHEIRPLNLISALVASFLADMVTVVFFGTKPCLYLPVKNMMPLHAYWALPLIGIVLGIMAYVYQYCLLSLKPIFSKITLIPRKYHSIIPLLLVIPVGLYNAHLLGGSHLLITSLFKHEFESSLSKGSMTFIWLAMILFLIRFIYSMLSYGASVPGGTFMPILVLGSIIRGYLRQYFGSQQLLKQRLLPTHHYHFNGSLLRSNCQGSFNRGYFTDRNGRDRATGLANDFNNLHRLLHS